MELGRSLETTRTAMVEDDLFLHIFQLQPPVLVFYKSSTLEIPRSEIIEGSDGGSRLLPRSYFVHCMGATRVQRGATPPTWQRMGVSRELVAETMQRPTALTRSHKSVIEVRESYASSRYRIARRSETSGLAHEPMASKRTSESTKWPESVKQCSPVHPWTRN